VMEALSHLCASPDGEAACRILTRRAPAWLTPGRAPEGETAAMGTQNLERTLGDLCSALEELSAKKPLVLIFEDLEWADDCTLNLISALARRRAPARLMVVTTCRTLKSSAEHPLKALKQDLLMRRLCAEIMLSPLGKTAVREMLKRELHQDALPTGLEGFVYQRAEGNPLFVIAIVEHLISERVLVRQGIDGAAQWEQRIPFGEIEGGVPNQLAQMIELEIEMLSAEERSLLEAGSLLRVAFPSWAVAAALKQDVGETEEACDALACRLHFVERAGQDELPDGTRSAFYVFAHGLYREVMYQRQTATRRGKRHIRIAERLQELFRGREADVAREMAMHFEAGGDWQRASDALRSAAMRARQRHAYSDAVELLEQALRVAENLGEKERSLAAREIRSDLSAASEGLRHGQELQGEMRGKSLTNS
jgi:predicted ATPase